MADDDLVLRHLQNIRAQMDVFGKQFDAIDKRFDAIDKRFDAVETRLESFRGEVNDRFDVMEDRFEGLEHHAAVTNSKLDAVHARLVTVETTRDETWAQVAASSAIANRLERGLAAQVAELRARVERLEAREPK